jgi:uncharacterized membrane protein YsdA (DUF1294 family)
MVRMSPLRRHLLLAFVLAVSGTVALWGLCSRVMATVPWALSWLGIVNLQTFVYYGVDKSQARRGGRRIPERVLHVLAVVGGSLGAFLAMRWFRHKTIKGGFRLVFWIIVVLQLALALWLTWLLLRN